MSKDKIVQQKIKYSRLTWRTKEIKNYIYQLRTKLTKAHTGKQISKNEKPKMNPRPIAVTKSDK